MATSGPDGRAAPSAPSAPPGGSVRRRIPLFQGLLPVERARIPVDVVAGVTLAALAIPEVMGYTSIAGMPVITGLYTILVPVLLFAVFGSSRHLVVGADSATAAVMAAGLAGMAATASPQYVALAGALALMAGVLLLLARLVGLGFIADFLSRTVLVGFLTGVGIQVASGQVGGLFGVPEGSGVTIASHTFDNTIGKLVSTLGNLGEVSWSTAAVSAGVLVVIVGAKRITSKVPGALIAVVGAIFVSWRWDLAGQGVTTLGDVPGGLPSIARPDVSWADVPNLMGTAVSIFVLVLAQSAATSRAYAAKYDDPFSEDVDLVGLGTAAIGAGFTGTFVVNGSPTKTQMVDSAGGRSQVAQLTMAVVVGIVLLFLTAPLSYMPKAVLAAVVFLIGIELVDLRGMRRILRVRPDEFVVATLTAAVVVLVGVEQGIVIAIVASVVDHIRRSYRPPTAVLEPEATGRGFTGATADPAARTEAGLVVYRFAAPLYYANAERFSEDVMAFTGDPAEPVRWLCLDLSSLPDVDYTGAETLRSLHTGLEERGVRLVFSEAMEGTRAELDRFGITDLVGADAYFESVAAAVAAFEAAPPGRSTPSAPPPAPPPPEG